MSLWRRAPREVYRVYGEDQYLEGERTPEAQVAAREDATTVESDRSAGSSWDAFAADVPPASPRTADRASARPRGLHTGRLVGVGLLVGVGVATLALVFLNASRQRGVAPEPLAQGARAEARQRVDRVSGVTPAPAIAHSESTRSAWASRSSVSPTVAQAGTSGQRLKREGETPSVHAPDPVARLERARAVSPRLPCDGAPAPLAVELPTPIAAEQSVHDEFGFEQ